MTQESATQTAQKPENPWLSLGINIAIPALVLMKLSGPEYLGPVYALIFALSFPLIYGIQDLVRQ